MTGGIALRILPVGDGRAFIVCSDGSVYVAGSGDALLQTYTHACGLVRASALHHDKGGDMLLALCGTDKHLVVVRMRPCANGGAFETHIVVRTPLSKAATCAAFYVRGEHVSVLVGDKFGDVSRFEISPVLGDASSIVAGCVSIVTDLSVGTLRSGLDVMVFSDRDEKVRLVRAAEPYPVEAFLLAHTSYVSGIAVLPAENGGMRVVSVGGDNALMVWDIPQVGGTISAPVSQITIVPDTESCDPVAVAVAGGRVAVAVSGEHCVRMFSLSADGSLASEPEVKLSAELSAISFDANGILFVATLSSVVRFDGDSVEWPLLYPATNLPRAAISAHTTVQRKRLFDSYSRDAADSASENE